MSDQKTGEIENNGVVANTETVNSNENSASSETTNTDTVSTSGDTVVPAKMETEVTTEKVEVSANADEGVVMTASSTTTSPIKIYALSALALATIGVVLWAGLEYQGRVATSHFAPVYSLFEKPAATVNGVGISKEKYEQNLAQIKIGYESQGYDMSSPEIATEIQEQAIQTLINTEVLTQAAKKAGINVTDEQIEARYSEVETGLGGNEALIAKMAELGVTEESLRADIYGELLIQTFLEEAVDYSSVNVTEEQIKAVYDQAVSLNPGAQIPPYEDVAEQIKLELESSEKQQLVAGFVNTLREQAEIVVN